MGLGRPEAKTEASTFSPGETPRPEVGTVGVEPHSASDLGLSPTCLLFTVSRKHGSGDRQTGLPAATERPRPVTQPLQDSCLFCKVGLWMDSFVKEATQWQAHTVQATALSVPSGLLGGCGHRRCCYGQSRHKPLPSRTIDLGAEHGQYK